MGKKSAKQAESDSTTPSAASGKKYDLPTTDPVLDDDGFETLGGEAGTEMAVGEVVTGPFGGIVRSMPGKKRGQEVPFYQVGNRTLLGGTVLRTRIEDARKAGKLKEGDIMRVTRLEDAKAKRGQNAAKIYRVQVKRSVA